MHNLYTILQLGLMSHQGVDPQTESRQVRCHRRNLECCTLQRSVTPRLIIRREHSQVLADKQVVVFLVKDSVVSVQIARNKQHLHIILRGVAESHALQRSDNTVFAHIVQPVCGKRHLQRRLGSIGTVNAVLQVATGLHHPCRHVHQSQDMGIGHLYVVTQAAHRFQEHIYALVAELVPAAGGQDYGLIAPLCSEQFVGHVEDAASCLLAGALKLIGSRQESVLKTVHGNNVRGLVKQLCALTGGNVTHRGEAIHLMRGLLLNGVLGLHVEFLCHLVTVVTFKELIQRLAVAANGAANRRGMSCEYGRYLRNEVFQEQRAQTGHPLVCVVNHCVIGAYVEVVETLHGHCGGV